MLGDSLTLVLKTKRLFHYFQSSLQLSPFVMQVWLGKYALWPLLFDIIQVCIFQNDNYNGTIIRKNTMNKCVYVS